MTPDPLPIGRLLRQLRTAAALSQEALSERAGVSVRAISDLERGLHRTPRLETVRLLADALNLRERERAALLVAVRPEHPATPPAIAERALARSTMPRPLTRLIGREREVAALCGMVRSGNGRMVTLTGPGGVGKTRLALAAGEALAGDFPDGAVFVDLAPVRDPSLVVAAIATALGLREARTQSVADQLTAYLRERAMVLVLDNFEHVLDAASLVSVLFATAPELRVLATSREPLRLAGEQVIPVAPLALPSSGQTILVGDPQQPEAVALFIERARAADPSFVLNMENRAAIAAIVQRLDGLPLAIELAAARVRALPPAALFAQLERQSLRLLSGGPRDQPGRQRTIRDAIGWSYALLTPEEQRLFRTLSIFVSGFTLEAAAALAGASEEEDGHVLDGVVSLIDKSLVRRVSGAEAEPRFAMLETIREFGLGQLAATGEETGVREAHVAWVLTLAEHAEAELEGRDQVQWLERLEAELPNLRTALGWLEHTGDFATQLHVAGALLWFWYIRGHLAEGRAWLERAFADRENASPSLRARALLVVSALAFGQHDYRAAEAFGDQCVAVANSIGDTRNIAAAHFVLGMVPLLQGNSALAVTRLDAALAQWRQIGDRFWVARTLTLLGGAVAGLGNFGRAAVLLEEALIVLREIGLPWPMAVTLASLGDVVLELGDVPRAEDLFRESLTLGWDIDDQRLAGETLVSMAVAAERRSQFQRAARLIGAADAVGERIRAPLAQIPVQIARYEHTINAVRSQLGDEAFVAARASGRAMPLAEAMAEAMHMPDDLSHSS